MFIIPARVFFWDRLIFKIIICYFIKIEEKPQVLPSLCFHLSPSIGVFTY